MKRVKGRLMTDRSGGFRFGGMTAESALMVLVLGGAPVLMIYAHGMSFVALFMFVSMVGAFTFPLPLNLLLQKIRKPKQVYIDERDLLIYKNAINLATLVS